jgi:hypothetical protein
VVFDLHASISFLKKHRQKQQGKKIPRLPQIYGSCCAGMSTIMQLLLHSTKDQNTFLLS